MTDAMLAVYANSKIMNEMMRSVERQRKMLSTLDRSKAALAFKHLEQLKDLNVIKQQSPTKTEWAAISAQLGDLAGVLAAHRAVNPEIFTAPKLKALSLSLSDGIEGIASTKATSVQLADLRDVVGQVTRRYQGDLVEVAAEMTPESPVAADDAAEDTTEDAAPETVQPTKLQLWLIGYVWALSMVWSFAFDQWAARCGAKYSDEDKRSIRNGVVVILLGEMIKSMPSATWEWLKK